MIRFCSLYSGSSGNSLFVDFNGTKLLIDAGLSAIRIIEALRSIGEDPSTLSAVLVSHEHVDHTRGAGVLSRKFDLPVYANCNTWQAMEGCLGKVGLHNRRCFDTHKEFEIGNVCISAFSIPHDAAEPVGFNFFSGSKKVTIATDIGHINRPLLTCLEDSDFLLLESNHDIEMLKVGPYPWHLKKRILGEQGHLSNEMAAKVIAYLAGKGTRKFLLGHLSRENNFPELAYQTVCNALTENKVCVGSDVLLDVALRDQVGKVIDI